MQSKSDTLLGSHSINIDIKNPPATYAIVSNVDKIITANNMIELDLFVLFNKYITISDTLTNNKS